jgi:hypothetical protein
VTVERPMVVAEEAGLVVVDDIPRRQERVADWPSRHCIYCEATGAPQSYSTHWYKTYCRSKGIVGQSWIWRASRVASWISFDGAYVDGAGILSRKKAKRFKSVEP